VPLPVDMLVMVTFLSPKFFSVASFDVVQAHRISKGTQEK
jgi:hypothetical protein